MNGSPSIWLLQLLCSCLIACPPAFGAEEEMRWRSGSMIDALDVDTSVPWHQTFRDPALTSKPHKNTKGLDFADAPFRLYITTQGSLIESYLALRIRSNGELKMALLWGDYREELTLQLAESQVQELRESLQTSGIGDIDEVYLNDSVHDGTNCGVTLISGDRVRRTSMGAGACPAEFRMVADFCLRHLLGGDPGKLNSWKPGSYLSGDREVFLAVEGKTSG